MQLSELNSKYEQLKKELDDSIIQKNKLSSENSDQASQIEELENQLHQLTKTKSSLAKQLDEARVGFEEESRLRSKYQSEMKMLQSDLDSLKEQYEEQEVRNFIMFLYLCVKQKNFILVYN